MTTTNAPDIDLLDREFWRSRQHEAWTWARANDPVFRDDKNDFWALTKHADVLYAERHPEIFSSAGAYRVNEAPIETNMIAQDDPAHLKQRRLINRGFTPRAARAKADEFEKMITEMVDAVTGDGQCEVIDAIAGQLPGRFTCNLLGLPEEEWRTVKGWSERLMRIDAAGFDEEVMQGLMEATMQIMGMVGQKVPELRECPADDGLLSLWANAEIDGTELPIDQIFHETGLFVAGGAETTRTAIAHGLRAFVDHPEAWERMYTEPDIIPTAVDEVIRWVTPLNNMLRKVTEDVELRDKTLRAGDRLFLVYPSANRDEEVFDEPFTFDIARDPNPHIAFGHGTHFCIGSNFARRELEILFGKLSRDWTNLRVIEEPDVEPNIFAPAVRSFTLGFDAR